MLGGVGRAVSDGRPYPISSDFGKRMPYYFCVFETVSIWEVVSGPS